MFLTLTCGVAVAVSLGFASWVRPAGRAHGRGLGAAYALLLGAVVMVVLAGDAFAFLFAWELVTLAFYLLAGYDRRRPGRAEASWVTLAVGKAGGAFLLLGFLLLSAAAGSFSLATWGGVEPGALRSAAYVLIILGCGAKVGAGPLQVWMPAGYAAAPGPARALMAAVAVNVGFYGLWGCFGVLGAPPLWLAIAVLLVGSGTALLGVAHATVQANLQRVIAYSSVENAGLILTGFGVALAGASLHQPALLAVGLLAATLQTVAHALAKGTVFLASGTIETATSTDRRPARCRPPPALQRHRVLHRRAGSGRAAPHRGVRLRMVPARYPHAAVPAVRPRGQAGDGAGRGARRADRRVRHRRVRASLLLPPPRASGCRPPPPAGSACSRWPAAASPSQQSPRWRSATWPTGSPRSCPRT